MKERRRPLSFHLSLAWRAARGHGRWRAGTLRKFREALDAPRPPKAQRGADPALVLGVYRAHLQEQARDLGLPVDEVLASRTREHWKLRARAMFAVSVEFDITGADLARALGLSKQIVSWNIKQANLFPEKGPLSRAGQRADAVLSPNAGA